MQSRAPLLEALLEYNHMARGNFHVPGHKQGQAWSEREKRWFGSILALDLTEVGHLDDLHDPRGVIADAQALAAEAFHADHTLFLVGGTTAGNMALILSLCQPGDRLLVQRNSHQSIFHGCYFAGVRAIYLPTRVDVVTGLAEPLQPAEIDQLLHQYPDAKGVFITSPSYEGMVQPIRAIADICHRFDVPLFVDEAHGAHFGFHPVLPLSAMQLGADVAVQSTHKMLSSMTMSSMLHIKGSRMEVDQVARALRMLESSSPSYPLLASLDVARRDIVTSGRQRMEQVLHHLISLRAAMEAWCHLREVQMPGIQDPLKCSLKADGRMTGFQLARWLEQRGIYTEFADLAKVLLVFSLGTTAVELQTLSIELLRLDQHLTLLPHRNAHDIPVFPKPVSSDLSFAEIRIATKEVIPLTEAEGRIATEMLLPYPPGIPVILPGELFTQANIHYLGRIIEAGGKVKGSMLSSVCQVSVIK
jgi:arginine decarboxylase